MGVFPAADLAGKVSGVDVAEAGLAADFDGLQKIFNVGVAGDIVLHFVIAVKGGYVPGNVWRDSGEKFGEAAEFAGIVVEAGDEEGDDFEPETHLVNAANAVEDGTDASTEFVVVAVVEAFEIDFVEIEMGTKKFEDLRSGVSVGDEAGDESGGFGFLEYGDGPLAGDERFVVGADENFCALGEGVANQEFRRRLVRRRYGAGIAQSLRGNPVLAVGAVEIASHHAEAVGQGAGMGVEKRFLLDGIAVRAGGVSPGNVERAATVVADFADSGLAFGDGTAVSAGEAADAVVGESFVERGVCFADALIEDGAEGGHSAFILTPQRGWGAGRPWGLKSSKYIGASKNPGPSLCSG